MKYSFGWCLAFGCLATFPGCAFFTGKPPLPKHASIEQLSRGASPADFATAVESADIIYFPEDRAASAGRSEPAALLLEAFAQSGRPFAVGWDLIDTTQQPALDEIHGKAAEARDAAIARLQLVGTGRAREHCRSVLRESRLPEVRHLALGCPAAFVAKIGTAERLTSEEEQLFPRGFNSPLGGLQAYASRLSARRETGEENVTGLYRAQMLRQQFAAEMIVRHFRSVEAGSKLLVFSNEADLETGQGIPFYVAQKLQLRQLVFGSDNAGMKSAKLLTKL